SITLTLPPSLISSLPTFVYLMPPLPPRSTLFPYTTLFRSLVTLLLAHTRHAVNVSILVDRAHAVIVDVREVERPIVAEREIDGEDRKSTRLNSSHVKISYAVFCLKKKSIIIRSYELLMKLT